MMSQRRLGIPPYFDPQSVSRVWRVPYQERAEAARSWARQHAISPAADDELRICLVLVDVQNTFCIPGYELFVGGRSGSGAVDDNRRLCEFIYRNLGTITQIRPTLDTHRPLQIFHAPFLVNEQGEHPAPYTSVSIQDVEQGIWKFNTALAPSLRISEEYGQEFLRHYVQKLRQGGKYELTVWPYHAMIGGLGHALVSAVEEAIFFHSIARYSQPSFQIKGDNPLTENYSVLKPEVLHDSHDNTVAEGNPEFIRTLMEFDAVIVAGQAKSHCVAWTIDDLLDELLAVDKRLVEKVHLLEDCTSPVVIPGVVDYTDEANAAFERFSDAGMHVVRSTEPLLSWPGLGRQSPG
jgi:nicotinamidase-related amidase